jgi:hypothetical protein
MTKSGSLTMLLDGHCSIELRLNDQTFGPLTATWNASISLDPDSQNGLSVNAPKQVDVKFNKKANHIPATFDIGKNPLDAVGEDFRKAFGPAIDISAAIEGLRKSFSGVYQGLVPPHTQLFLSSPVFTPNGDLYMQLFAKNTSETVVMTKDTPIQGSQPVKTDGVIDESIRKRKGTVVQCLQVGFTLT